MYTYHVWGIRRCGNHAVIGWILKNSGPPYVHFNDIQDPRNPLTPGGVIVSGVPMWRYKRGILRKIRYRFLAPDRSSFAGHDPSLDCRGLAALANLTCRVFSYEDKFLAEVDGVSSVAVPREVSKRVFVLRDPFNLFASLLRSGYFNRKLEELPALYCSHAEEFLRHDGTRVVGINYNDWVQDPAYRIATARSLGFQSDGSAYDSVPFNGGGSSFEGRSFMGKASQMDLFGRWRHMAGDESFRRLIWAPEVHAIAMKIYPTLAREVYGTLSQSLPARMTSTRLHAKSP
jgi:hypothetical protein